MVQLDSEGSTVFLPVSVMSWEARDDRVRAGLVLREVPHARSDWPESLRALFNRRASFRVRPDPDRPVPVTLRAQGACWSGGLVDISVGGVAGALDAAAADILESFAGAARARFLLPGGLRPIEARVCPHSGRVRDGRSVVGFSFESFSGPRQAAESRIARYILRRQQEDIRHRAR